MKKISFVILIFLLISSTDAQILRGIGVKVGTTFSSQDWNYSGLSSIASWSPDSKTGFNAGVFAEFLNNENFSLVTELNFLEKGAEHEMPVTTADNPDGTGATILWDASLTYINFSLLGKVRYNLNVVSPYIVLGPSLDVELNKSEEVSSFDIDKTRLGLKVGIGSEINILPVKLFAEFVYQHDFKSLFKNQLLEITSKAFDLRIGVMF